ncbi:MAG: YbaN family protein [Gammaproteobacteria bacterium]|nr:YbaN family protein [Gammaproteobacteria bacterium]
MKNSILKIFGGVSLVLGLLGAIVPLLPSTCFILLATWAFSKSSPKFHSWLTQRSPFSSTIKNWQKHRVVPKQAKVAAGFSLVTSFIITYMFVKNENVLIALGLGMIVLLGYLLTRKSLVNNEIKYSHIDESHQRANKTLFFVR